ncbi:hypothetical protein CPTMiller_00274 [Citrobacter phage Miller]|uniref:Uncharacterized protein n=4 Tax=Pseudotevenvirus TaxID=2842979 RepID=A0A1B1IXY7_9CAUD|nr:hypothetical protein CPTMiller_00274 [Citrobacter phage Miller]YP_009285808.1 hypothetical protein BI032_gp079 [Citrobacter phage vB_CfrM_CfP1]YP_239264.1 hypothetical protein RB43ORF288c [Escherichia phage RB43]QPX73138.1 hypothetical protein [Citrobacter phage vB_Cfr_Xman]CCK74129.1 protein of unknown function [Pseudotevenvirus RB43]AAX78810.1 hypothetical protein RB43ORF288c [Escherichia phage RB43]AIK68210.1 hypothetical protein CPTMiller_00274 [Citrobacter phage Miller]ANS06190.1 hyp
MNNPVAKHDFNRASTHADRKRDSKEAKRKQKHKGKFDEKCFDHL